MDNNSELNNNVTPGVANQPTNGTQELPIVNPTAVNTNTNTNTAPSPTSQAPLTPSVSNPTETGPIQIEEKPVDPNFVDRTTNPGVIGNIAPTKAEDPNGLVNENLKKVEVQYTPPSKGKTVALIMFFIFLILFVIFLPEVTTIVDKLLGKNQEEVAQKITTGKLVCEFSTNTANLDKDYKLIFGFSNNKLEKLNYTTTTKGDPSLDAETMDDLANRCKMLKEFTSSVTGVNVTCDYSEGKLVENQDFDYASLDTEGLDSAYTEAGGTNPQYTNGQDMDSIEKNMNASGYTCKRQNN